MKAEGEAPTGCGAPDFRCSHLRLRIATPPEMAVSITGAGFATINDGCGGTATNAA
jgi:hypothetical protein